MKKIDIYTDGACSGNPGKGGLGVVIIDDYNQVATLKEGYRHTTNNRMEILAAIRAIETVRNYILDNGINTRETDIKVTVLTDSQLVVNTMKPKDPWSKKANKDLWERLDQAVNRLEHSTGEARCHIKVFFEKVKGHADDTYNTLADGLAVNARELYADNIDEAYEKIHAFGRPCVEPVPEPEIEEVRFCNVRDKMNRRVEVLLTNGTVVKIIPTCAGFAQTECTVAEARVTVEIAQKFVGWLNGWCDF